MDILDPRECLPGGVRQFSAHSILATFPDADGARAAADELRSAGYRDVQVDEVGWVESDTGRLQDQPWPHTLTGHKAPDRRVAAMADPSASGLSLGGTEPIGGHRYLLTVALDEPRFKEAVAIIRKHNGNVDTGGPR